MKYLEVFSPADSGQQLALSAQPTDHVHSAVIVDIDHIISLRDDWVMQHSLRSRTQVRPFYMFNGAAEFQMLHPITKLVDLPSPDVMSFMMSLAKNMSVVARSASSLKSQQAVASMANLISSLSTATTSPGLMQPISDSGKGDIKIANGYEYFTGWLYDVIGSPTSREAIFKQMSNPKLKSMPVPLDVASNPTASIINELIQGMIVFGFNGSGAPLLSGELSSSLASRLAVEHEISETSSYLFVRDRKMILALWYFMYAEATATPAAYDAAFPAVPMSPNNLSTAGSVVSKAGSICHTAFACATAPTVFGIEIMRIQIEHSLEFLQTLSHTSDDVVQKIKKQLGFVADTLPQFGYAPIRNMASAIMKYLADFTGSRFLLPGFFAKYSLTGGATGFPILTGPKTPLTPSGFRGFTPSVAKATEFGGLDVPMIMEQLLVKAKDLNAACMNAQRVHQSVIGTLPQNAGAVLVHLEGLDKLPVDPRLGEIAYPEITRSYMLPSYVPKWVELKSDPTPRWAFDSYMYKSFYPRVVQKEYLLSQSSEAALAWIDEVDLAVSPSSGQEFSYLPIPSHLTYDADTSVIPNDIRAMKQFLASSPHRPMSSVTDFFTPLYQVLAMGRTRQTAVANALAAIGFLYQRTDEGKGAVNDAASWDLISPQILTVYGIPLLGIISANSPFKEKPADLTSRVDLSHDGMFMFVLHTKMPRAQWLSYIPFVMFGGCTISLPIARDIYKTTHASSLKEIGSKGVEGATLYGTIIERLNKTNFDAKDLVDVKSWSMNISSFPHIFFSNRYTSASHAILTSTLAVNGQEGKKTTKLFTAIDMLETKHVIAGDAMSPYGAILSYQESPVAFVDLEDQLTAFQGSTINDLTVEQKKNKTKATASAPGPAPEPHLQDLDPLIDTRIENSDQSDSATVVGDSGTVITVTDPPITPGVSSPVTIPPSLPDTMSDADREAAEKLKGLGNLGQDEE